MPSEERESLTTYKKEQQIFTLRIFYYLFNSISVTYITTEQHNTNRIPIDTQIKSNVRRIYREQIKPLSNRFKIGLSKVL